MEKRAQIINLLVEGNSLSSTSRIADVSITTVMRLLVKTGLACMNYHNKTVKNLQCKRVQCDEIWSFVYSKSRTSTNQRDIMGDVWVWVAMDPDTKLVVSWFVGTRDDRSADRFIRDMASRIDSHVQITTDGFKSYPEAVERYFDGRADYGQIVKDYKENYGKRKTTRKYNMGTKVGIYTRVRFGKPDPQHISTSLIERQNLTMRMCMRRFTRRTDAFSRKIENHIFAIALHFVYYNFCRIHSTIRVTPAMEAGLTKDFLELKDIVDLSTNF